MLELCDAFALGAFAVIGAQVAQGQGYTAAGAPVVLLLSAVLSATGGGVVRDVLTLTPPRVLSSKQELYATCAAAGAAAYVFLPGSADAKAVVGVLLTGVCGRTRVGSGSLAFLYVCE